MALLAGNVPQKRVLGSSQKCKGEPTAKSCISFFEKESFTRFRQNPAASLFNGGLLVKVTFISTPGSKNIFRGSDRGSGSFIHDK
jgi:hypothetical protein